MPNAKHFSQDRLAVVSLAFLIFIGVLLFLSPWITPYSSLEQNSGAMLQTPSAEHWMGTDALGRDLFSRILSGAQISLTLGIFSSLVALFFGIVIGCLAGLSRKWVDTFLMRGVDLFYVLPSPLLAILLTLLLGRGFLGLFIALTLTAWMTQARLVRAQVLQARKLTYVEAARALGVGPYRLVTKHILPNIAGPLIASLTLQIPTNMMHESFLSFIGVGLQPPLSSWGTLANEGFRAMRSYPHLILYPSLALFLTLLAFQFIGEGVRRWLDPLR